MSAVTRRPTAVPAFFVNQVIESYAAKSSTPISLKHMINFGNAGRNKGEKEEADKLLKGGNFLRTELPTRLSHRLRDLQELPLGVASHPRITHVYELYLEAFEQIRKFPVITDMDDNDRFCQFMRTTLDKHRVVIPEMAIGIAEASPTQLPPAALDRIMLRMLRSRISRRVITEQHLALTAQFRERQRKGKSRAAEDRDEDETRVGIVDTKLNAADVVRKCAELIKALGGPESEVPIIIEGATERTFAYISEHLEFMLFELIKNAAHSTISAHGVEAAASHPTVVTIVHRPRDLELRVSDQGGGIPPYGGLPPDPDDLSSNPLLSPTALAAPLSAQRLDIFSFSHMRRYYQHHAALASSSSQNSPSSAATTTTASSSARSPSPPTVPVVEPALGIMALHDVNELAGTVQEQLERRRQLGNDVGGQGERELIDAQMRSGIGLPLSKMYAEYFSGSLDIYTIQGYGSDAFLRIPKFGTAT
ncbi:alpha-ketoacid dehydrogenase kinase [Rhodotorula sp. JG-1b]|nr:alpha-ketoacid dehydrogenase kinase [Rhodotorula sp. JG-1b]